MNGGIGTPQEETVTLTLLHCPHTYWLEAHAGAGIITAICRNKTCQESARFTPDEWNAMGERALNTPVRV